MRLKSGLQVLGATANTARRIDAVVRVSVIERYADFHATSKNID
jgi:hypothetical protein